MSNGARHTWGFFMGVVLTAALVGLLIFGSYRLQHGYVTQFHKQDKWIGGGLLLGAGVVFALLVGSRLSPLGSLIGGLVLTAAGVLFFVSQKTTADLINRFPLKEQRVTLAGLEEEGFILVAGVGLLFSSLFPSRWRGRDRDEDAGYEYGLPEPRDAYRAQEPVNEPQTGQYATREQQQQPTDRSPYESPHGSYDGYDGYDGPQQQAQSPNYERTSYDAPLYEPQQQQYGRSPFNPPEDGGTREMHRPD